MSSRIEKQFSNAATTPILITMSFELNDDKIIERIDAAGGTPCFSDDAKAERRRMSNWVRDTFIGQHVSFLHAHNGNVPAPGFTETSGSADPLNLDQHDRRFVVVNTFDFSPEAVAKAMQGTPGLVDRILRRDFDKQRKVGVPPELGTGYGGITHPADILEMLTGAKVPEATREFLDSVVFEGDEQPPAAGERYFSVISGSTYTVIDARRKLHSTDHYVTMERDGDKHRTKFTYRDHATWLTTWRPVDDEGQPRKVVEVELKQDTRDASDASDALRGLGETAHEAAQATFEFHATDAIARIVRELNKRLPGWAEQPPGPVVYDTTDLIIRAIRWFNRRMRNYEQLAVDSAKELRRMVDLETENAALKKELGGSWAPERIRTEQDRMREMVYEYARLFRIIHGTDRLKTHMQAFGVPTMRFLSSEQYLDFMRDCRTYAEKCMP